MQRAYTKQITQRDKRCFLSYFGECSDTIHIHHIKTRASGGSDEYNNLIMLCSHHHLEYAHGKDGDAYKKMFQDYTSTFTRPDNRDKVMERSKKQWDNFKKYRRLIDKRKRDKLKAIAKPKSTYKPIKLKSTYKPEKSAYQYSKEKFIEKHGISPWKYAAQKSKERKERHSNEQNTIK